MHSTGQRRGGKNLCPLAGASFSPPATQGSPLRCSQVVSKAEHRIRLTKNCFPKEVPLDFKEKTKKLESGLKMKASRVYVPRQG